MVDRNSEHLETLVRKLAVRSKTRTEADIQSTLAALLLAAPLALERQDLQEPKLESPVGQRRRIDVEAGLCVFEVKRDLRPAHIVEDAREQLSGYVDERTRQLKQRYVGVLTDGVTWQLYRLQGESLVLVDTLELNQERPSSEALCVWLEGVLAIGEDLEPTPFEIERQLGSNSPAHALDFAELSEIYARGKDRPDLKLKRELWAKLLRTAFGNAFQDDDRLFVQHTLLVIIAEVIAHAVLGLDLRQLAPRAILSGQQFRAAKIRGVIEPDFFEWPVELEGGEAFVRSIARRLARFRWTQVEHDVMKTLYESIIPAAQRKQLGEYYTPDWMANKIVSETIDAPLGKRILDPSCGSGTFLFHAIRAYLAAADSAGLKNADAIASVCEHVLGIDLHPVAITLARVTYLLAIGSERLRKERGSVSIPVFLGDSLQWGSEDTLHTHGALVISTSEPPGFFSDLRFPDAVLGNARNFDELVLRMAELATNRTPGTRPPSLDVVYRQYAIAPADQPTLAETFEVLCSLHDQGRDHIWAYYVRNRARPRWVAQPGNRVDYLVGNPPWLSFRFMTEKMQTEFRALLQEHDLWPGARAVTNVDLSALFVVRAIDRYLKSDGRFAFVMPWAVLSRPQFRGFRTGRWRKLENYSVSVAFDEPWDFHGVKPAFFEVPCSVLRGRRVSVMESLALPETAEVWSGRLPETSTARWQDVAPSLETTQGAITEATTSNPKSPYAARFAQGATFVPRMLCFIERESAGPLGGAAGETAVRSRRSAVEKKPWKTLPALTGSVEDQFLWSVQLGETLLPFVPQVPFTAVVPWDGKRLLASSDASLANYPGLQRWYSQAERLWTMHRSSKRMTLLERWNFHRGLENQFVGSGSCPEVRVVYATSGVYLAAGVLTDPHALVDTKLYWGSCSSLDEAWYLAAILNSEAATLAVRKYQSRGEHNPRDFHKYVWQLPIPLFDPKVQTHRELATQGKAAAELVRVMALPRTRFEKQRGYVRKELLRTDIGRAIENAVAPLLGAPQDHRSKGATAS